MRRLAPAVVLLAFAAPASAASTTVSMVENAFKPATTSVSVGDTVTWKNDGQSAHEVSSSAFSSGNIDSGKSWSWTATKAGTFSYVCRYHEAQGMKGTLVVRAAGAAAPAPATGHPNTGGDDAALGLLLLGATATAGLGLRYGWRTR